MASRDVEFLSDAFNLIKKLHAFGVARNKKPLQKQSELGPLDDAIEKTKTELFDLDVCSFLPLISLHLDYYNTDALLCMLDVDTKDTRILDAIGNLCYAEETTRGYHLFLYTDKRIQVVYQEAEIITHKFARFTARNIEPYCLPFFRDSSFILNLTEKLFTARPRREIKKYESMASKITEGCSSWFEVRPLLAKNGWLLLKEDDRYEYWNRPGAKTQNHDAVYNKGRNRWQVYSTSTEFDTRSYFVHEVHNILLNKQLF